MRALGREQYIKQLWNTKTSEIDVCKVHVHLLLIEEHFVVCNIH